uniref:RRM domain-containing protein n=1 Tax=Ditylenchus dipsaci TaxID=166011 RepID=A0A915CUY5_9BILA
MAGRMRSRSRSPLRTKNGILGGERRAPPPRDRNGKLNQSSNNMVYLSNLPFELTWMELKDFVREKAGEVNFVETLENREGKSKGCAVVEFKSRESAVKCVEAMHRTELRGRLIVVKEIRDPVAFFRKVREDTGVDFLGSRDRGNADRRAPPSRTLPSAADSETFGLSPAFLDQLKIKLPLINRIFLTNISYACGVGRLYDVCSLAGKVTWLDLQLDKEGKSKGMAVCQYSHPIEAVQAVSMLHDQRLFDRVLSVKMDRFDKDPSTDRREGELPVGLRGIGMGLGAGGAPLTDVASVISSIAPASAPSAVVHHINGNSQLAQLASSNNPFGASANSFSSASVPQIQLQSAQIQQSQAQPIAYDHPTSFHSTPTGYGSTGGNQVLSQPAAQNYYNGPAGGVGGQVSQPTNGPHFFKQPNGGGVQPKQDYVKSEYVSRDTGGFGSASGQMSAQHGAGYGTTGSSGVSSVGGYGGGHAYDQSISRVILIKNLPLDYTWTIVSDRVQQYGDLESVEMISQGVAKVRFVKLSDAERAKANLHGTTVEGRVIAIEYL